MQEYPSILLEQAVTQMASLPGVGRRTALRLVLHLLRQSEKDVDNFANAFLRLRKEVIYCKECHNISDTELCPICASPRRNHLEICVVENIRDVLSIERTGQFRGVYHVLGGIISPMDGIGPGDLEIDSLIERVTGLDVESESDGIEVILALPTTLEGDTTNFYIYRRLTTAAPRVKVSQLARGVAVGNDLEYTDEITLGRSLINRTPFKA